MNVYFKSEICGNRKGPKISRENILTETRYKCQVINNFIPLINSDLKFTHLYGSPHTKGQLKRVKIGQYEKKNNKTHHIPFPILTLNGTKILNIHSRNTFIHNSSDL